MQSPESLDSEKWGITKFLNQASGERIDRNLLIGISDRDFSLRVVLPGYLVRHIQKHQTEAKSLWDDALNISGSFPGFSADGLGSLAVFFSKEVGGRLDSGITFKNLSDGSLSFTVPISNTDLVSALLSDLARL